MGTSLFTPIMNLVKHLHMHASFTSFFFYIHTRGRETRYTDKRKKLCLHSQVKANLLALQTRGKTIGYTD